MGTCVIFKWNLALVITIALYLMTVNMSLLSVGWIYVHEVSNSKTAAVGTTINWSLLLLVGFVTKPLFEHPTIGEYTFFIYGIVNSIMTLFVGLWMKETKGLSEEEVGRLYLRDFSRIETELKDVSLASPESLKIKRDASTGSSSKE